jgi:hypothetical protein
MIIVIGLVHLKEQQDIHVAQEDQYIRRIIDLSGVTDDVHDEDDTTDCADLRIIICMSKDGSE